MTNCFSFSASLTVGQLIGPRGNTLKKMEADSGAKIAIRGKGSVKEGKGGSDRATDSNLEEDLHCLIIGPEEAIAKATKLVNAVIETVCCLTSARSRVRDLNDIFHLALFHTSANIPVQGRFGPGD